MIIVLKFRDSDLIHAKSGHLAAARPAAENPYKGTGTRGSSTIPLIGIELVTGNSGAGWFSGDGYPGKATLADLKNMGIA
jgi:hypothetical protein